MYLNILRQILLMSKYALYGVFLQVLFLSMVSAKDGNAQGEKLMEIIVTVDWESTRLENAFSELSKKTGFSFNYHNGEIDVYQPITMNIKKESMQNVLLHISKVAGLKFRRINSNIHVGKRVNKEPIIVEEIIEERTITGKVTSEDEEGGLPGVNVLIRGTTQGTVTDTEGNYNIEVPDEEIVLVFSFVGYQQQEIAVGTRTVVNVVMAPDVTALSELVVVGYGTQKKSDLTGSIGSLSGVGLDKLQVADPSQLLMGRVTGVRVESVGGSPGAPSNIVVRGVSSLTTSNPLFVIDGMFTDNMDFLNPSDIKSIQVLKDASAAAIYGSRAANGVIIITTNDGQGIEGVQVDLELSYGTQTPIKEHDWLTGAQYADYRNQLAIANTPEGQNPILFPGFNQDLDPTINTIVEDIAMSSAPVSNVQLAVRGGSDVFNYNISGNWMNQEGIIVGSDFDRKTFRTNLNLNKGKFKLTETFAISNTKRTVNSVWNLANNIIPSIPFENPDNLGGYNAATMDMHGFDGNNHIAKSLLWDRYTETGNLLLSLNASYEVIEGLTVNANLGLQQSTTTNYRFTPAFFLSANQRANLAESEVREGKIGLVSLLGEGTLNYKRSINQHNFEVLGGVTFQETTIDDDFVYVSGFPSDDIIQVSAASTVVLVTGTETVNTLGSVFGRLNYNYAEKYFLTATIRRDGSSRFPEDNRYGTFPSIGVGYTISNEEFLANNPVISNLKLRASYGELGSQNIGDYAFIPTLNINSDVVLGTAQDRVPGVSQTVFANPNLVWETTKTFNIGLDAAFFDSKLTFTADYFNKESEDILVDLRIPPSSGTTEPVAQNAATMRNKGLELALNYSNNFGELELFVGSNFTYLNNEVLSLGENIAPITAGPESTRLITRTAVGGEVGAYYGYQMEGIYRDQADLDADLAAGLADPNAQLGDFKFADLDGNGVLDSDDQQALGSYIPDYEFGFVVDGKYKGFDFNLIFNGVQGVEIWNSKRDDNLLSSATDNKFPEALDYWTPENPDANLPRLGGGAGNTRSSSFFVESGNYFRLRNMQVGYSFSSLANKVGLRKVRLYGSIQNLFTITDYSGYYPEIGRSRDNPDLVVNNTNTLFFAGIDQSSYPTPRTFLMGLQIGF